MKLSKNLWFVFALGASSPALAQQNTFYNPNASTTNVFSALVDPSTGKICTVVAPCSVLSSSSTGSQAVTLANGASVNLGSLTDTAFAGGASGSLTAIEKGIYANTIGLAAAQAAILPVGTAASAQVIATGAHNIFGYNAVQGAVAGCIILYDSATIPTTLVLANVREILPLAANAGVDFEVQIPAPVTLGVVELDDTTCALGTVVAATPVYMSARVR